MLTGLIGAKMGYLKGKSTPIIFERRANLRYRYGNRQKILCKHCRVEQREDCELY